MYGLSTNNKAIRGFPGVDSSLTDNAGSQTCTGESLASSPTAAPSLLNKVFASFVVDVRAEVCLHSNLNDSRSFKNCFALSMKVHSLTTWLSPHNRHTNIVTANIGALHKTFLAVGIQNCSGRTLQSRSIKCCWWRRALRLVAHGRPRVLS